MEKKKKTGKKIHNTGKTPGILSRLECRHPVLFTQIIII